MLILLKRFYFNLKSVINSVGSELSVVMVNKNRVKTIETSLRQPIWNDKTLLDSCIFRQN